MNPLLVSSVEFETYLKSKRASTVGSPKRPTSASNLSNSRARGNSSRLVKTNINKRYNNTDDNDTIGITVSKLSLSERNDTKRRFGTGKLGQIDDMNDLEDMNFDSRISHNWRAYLSKPVPNSISGKAVASVYLPTFMSNQVIEDDQSNVSTNYDEHKFQQDLAAIHTQESSSSNRYSSRCLPTTSMQKNAEYENKPSNTYHLQNTKSPIVTPPTSSAIDSPLENPRYLFSSRILKKHFYIWMEFHKQTLFHLGTAVKRLKRHHDMVVKRRALSSWIMTQKLSIQLECTYRTVLHQCLKSWFQLFEKRREDREEQEESVLEIAMAHHDTYGITLAMKKLKQLLYRRRLRRCLLLSRQLLTARRLRRSWNSWSRAWERKRDELQREMELRQRRREGISRLVNNLSSKKTINTSQKTVVLAERGGKQGNPSLSKTGNRSRSPRPEAKGSDVYNQDSHRSYGQIDSTAGVADGVDEDLMVDEDDDDISEISQPPGYQQISLNHIDRDAHTPTTNRSSSVRSSPRPLLSSRSDMTSGGHQGSNERKEEASNCNDVGKCDENGISSRRNSTKVKPSVQDTQQAARERREKLNQIRQASLQRAQLKMKESEELKRRRQEAEEEAQLSQIKQHQMEIQEQKKRNIFETKKRQEQTTVEKTVLGHHMKKADSYYQKQLLITKGFGPWLRLMNEKRLNMEKAETYHHNNLMQKTWNHLYAYVTATKTESARRLQKQTVIATSHYRVRLLRSTWTRFLRNKRMLRAKAAAVFGQATRFSPMRRAFLAWRLSLEKQIRLEVKRMYDMKLRGNICIKRFIWNKWISHVAEQRVEKEIGLRSNLMWAKVKSWMDK